MSIAGMTGFVPGGVGVKNILNAMPMEKSCTCGDALKYAILTDRKVIPAETRKKLAVLLDKYL